MLIVSDKVKSSSYKEQLELFLWTENQINSSADYQVELEIESKEDQFMWHFMWQISLCGSLPRLVFDY